MRCTRPTALTSPSTGEALTIGCRKCHLCRQARAEEWILRLKAQQRSSLTSAFLTFTYNQDNLPFTEDYLATLEYDHIQLFLKSLRKHIDKYFPEYPKLSYYTTGEYGGLTERPHYHSIMFNIPEEYLIPVSVEIRPGVRAEKLLFLEQLWGRGHIYPGTAEAGSIAYATGYLQKDIKIDYKTDDTRKPERNWISKGMGKAFLTDEMIKYLKSNLEGFVTIKGDGKKRRNKKIPIPKYYANQVYTDEEKDIIYQKRLLYLETQDELKNTDYAKWKKQETDRLNNSIYQHERKRRARLTL